MPNIDAPTRAILEADISEEAVEASIQAAMTNYIQAILEADISEEAVEASIQAAMTNYIQRFGPIRHVWVHPKDVPAELLVVDKITLERKGGCPRHKVWVM